MKKDIRKLSVNTYADQSLELEQSIRTNEKAGLKAYANSKTWNSIDNPKLEFHL